MKNILKNILITVKAISITFVIIFAGLLIFLILLALLAIILSPILPKSDYHMGRRKSHYADCNLLCCFLCDYVFHFHQTDAEA